MQDRKMRNQKSGSQGIPLAIHACCGPCSLEPIRLLQEEGFEPTIFWSNPNIQPQAEYDRRLATLLQWAHDNNINVVDCDNESHEYVQYTADRADGDLASSNKNEASDKGRDDPSSAHQQQLRDTWEEYVAPKARAALLKTDKQLRETRCRACYTLRLEQTAQEAVKRGFKYFSTTLAVSPYQHFEVCGEELKKCAKKHGMQVVWRDFREHYPEATRRSRELGMYRQKYCGCRFSASEAALERRARKKQLIMKTDDFDYNLPEKNIAQFPVEPRDACRLMVLQKSDGSIQHKRFRDIIDFLEPGDLLVANKTRVLPARLIGKKPTGALSEILLLNRREDLDAKGFIWEALVNPGRRLKKGACIEFFEGGAHASSTNQKGPILSATVLDFIPHNKGARLIRFEIPQNHQERFPSLDDAIHAVGAVPLPPYIPDYKGDPKLYQTVYAMEEEHSAAAPTAGLHFTPELLDTLKKKGINIVFVELEVGVDTFRLVEEDDPTKHHMHTERYHVGADVVEAVEKAKQEGHRVVAVGTTSVRSLESAWDEKKQKLIPKENATTNLFLLPGSTFHVVDALITNFHVPRSTLMMLVSAFAGREHIMHAYEEAIKEGYRLLSFGDAMLIIEQNIDKGIGYETEQKTT